MGSGPAEPEVTVVVATHDRADLLADLLASLDRVETDRAFDVVVVDDGSSDATPALLRTPASPHVRTIRRTTSAGPAVARNQGWRSSPARWIAFTDDDCTVTPAWLEQLVRSAEAASADLVQGRTEPDPHAAAPHPPWAKTQRVTSFNHRFQACNLLVSRDLLDRLDGFDETFPFAGEDADLGWRAIAAGARTAFADAALVHHTVWTPGFRGFLADRVRWADLVRVVARHRGARRLLFAGVFFRRNHATVVLGVPALAALAATTGWWTLPLGAGAAVVATAWRSGDRRWPTSTRLRWAGQALVGAAWETALFVRASVRYRTLVL